MKSTIALVTESLIEEGRLGRTVAAVGIAAALAAGSAVALSGPTPIPEPGTEIIEQTGKLAYSTQYLDYIRYLENRRKVGWNSREKKWYPHGSREGGRSTIAYGHKMQSDAEEKKYASGITEAEAMDLLKQDLDKAWDSAAKYVRSKHDIDMATLSTKQQEMLTEYAFNLGSLNGFPKFTRAVVHEDWETARKEYKRTYKDGRGVRRELARNKHFYARYLK